MSSPCILLSILQETWRPYVGVLFFPLLLKLHSSFSDPLVLLSHLACVLMAMSTLVYDPLVQ